MGQDHHPVRGPRPEAVEGAVLGAGLDESSFLQHLMALVQQDLIEVKVALRWRPEEGQAAGGVGLHSQLSDGCRA